MIKVKQDSLYPFIPEYIPEYIPDIPDVPVPVIELDFTPEPQEDYNATLDELETTINDLFLTIRGMRSRYNDL